jgi:ABC-2 type transport system ATP-binding protein
MDNIVHTNNLCKQYKILSRKEGILGAVKDLFSCDYKIIKAVDNVSIQIKEGELIGFIGPNGAGKSTMIKMLTGILQPSSGELKIYNYTPFKQRRHYLRYIGVVFGQRTQHWWELPVIESLKVLKQIYRIPTNTYMNMLRLANKMIDLSPFYPIPVRNLSLGQRMLCDIVASFCIIQN